MVISAAKDLVRRSLASFGYVAMRSETFAGLVRTSSIEASADTPDLTDAIAEAVNATSGIDDTLQLWLRREFAAIFNAHQSTDLLACEACDTTFVAAEVRGMTAKCMFTGLDLPRHECPNCGLIFGPMALIRTPPYRLSRLYDLLYRMYAEGETNWAQEKTFFLLNPSRRGTYLNYACGAWAKDMQHLIDRGWNVQGYEPTIRQTHPRIAKSLAELNGQKFHGIFTNNYLEHVQSLRAFFGEMQDMLRDDGTMAHTTACYKYRYEGSPFHLYFPTERSLEQLSKRTGFEIVAKYDDDSEESGVEFMCRVFRKHSS